jgi:hypothetical protein
MKLSEKIDQDMAEITTPTMQTGAVKVWAQHIAAEVRKLEGMQNDRWRAELIALMAGALSNPRVDPLTAIAVVVTAHAALEDIDSSLKGPAKK